MVIVWNTVQSSISSRQPDSVNQASIGNIPQLASEDSDDPGRPMHLLMQCQRSKIVGGNPTIRATIPMMTSIDIASCGIDGQWEVGGMSCLTGEVVDRYESPGSEVVCRKDGSIEHGIDMVHDLYMSL
jgi:hypothetical protein